MPVDENEQAQKIDYINEKLSSNVRDNKFELIIGQDTMPRLG